MTEALRQWRIQNDEYVAVQLGELRAKIAQLATSAASETAPSSAVAQVEECHGRTSLISVQPTDDCEWSDAPALVWIAQRFGLTDFERRLLFFTAAVEFDAKLGATCARLRRDLDSAIPNFDLASLLWPDATLDALATDGPLRRFRLIDLDRADARPLTTSRLRVDERTMFLILGMNQSEIRFSSFVHTLDVSDLALPATHLATAQSIVEALEHPARRGEARSVCLAGADHSGKRLLAAQVAKAIGRRLVLLQIERLPETPDELFELISVWERESKLEPFALYVPLTDSPKDRRCNALLFQLSRCSFPVLFDTCEEGGCLDPETVFDVSKPTTAEQRALWSLALGAERTPIAVELAAQFNMSQEAIERAARRVLNVKSNSDSARYELWTACRKETRPVLDRLAQRIELRAGWDDLVLPEEALGQLRQLIGQVRSRGRVLDDWGFRAKLNRGFGVTALFSGASGTGKTMAAEVIAAELELDLYRVDLSSVVDKYVGETEKNLRRLFDAADDGGAILLFDEADSLFGRRSEVKDAHDRYANIETNYLLQRMESYRGLAILATNTHSALDSAFLRRLRFVIEFPFPDSSARQRIWERVFPALTPCASVDWKRVAQIPITGGNIHNIALNAAFAAGCEPEVGLAQLLRATQNELRKVNRPVSLCELGYSIQEGVPG